MPAKRTYQSPDNQKVQKYKNTPKNLNFQLTVWPACDSASVSVPQQVQIGP